MCYSRTCRVLVDRDDADDDDNDGDDDGDGGADDDGDGGADDSMMMIMITLMIIPGRPVPTQMGHRFGSPPDR